MHMAIALGYEVVSGYLPCGMIEFTDGRTIWFRPAPDAREEALRIAHALAHCVLMAEGEDHTESDAWRLTAALLEPDRRAWRFRQAPPRTPRWFWACWVTAVSETERGFSLPNGG